MKSLDHLLKVVIPTTWVDESTVLQTGLTDMTQTTEIGYFQLASYGYEWSEESQPGVFCMFIGYMLYVDQQLRYLAVIMDNSSHSSNGELAMGSRC